ncbi:MAG: hypothetical protein HON53_21095 [Planctomycetaceae bacterium]|mgnify:FL=1|nr:hypothetical protein [Planctomycetaceae bacterium]MBT6153284.1 hypothetical protein [Planctomycetaceae bacterium]MBT6486941.1 hypothetical protein [Planctomycetaceae bacterium]MBT6493625.1 hypothetical protein [Planctomycetaceae bacterium]
MRIWLTQVVLVGCVLAVGSGVLAAEQSSGERKARAFWKALAQGDVMAMKEFYAEKVTLKAGSELLKPRWALSPKADRKKDLAIERDKLLAGYERLIGGAGRERWRGAFGKIDAKKITTAVAKGKDKPLIGVLSGDTVLTVATGPGDDRLVFVLRQDKLKRWQVVAEATDY